MEVWKQYLCLFFSLALFLILLGYGLWYKNQEISNIFDPAKFQNMVFNFPSITSNTEFLCQLKSSFISYMIDLVREGKVTPEQLVSLEQTGASIIPAISSLLGIGKDVWSVFLNDYYYKNNPSLEIT